MKLARTVLAAVGAVLCGVLVTAAPVHGAPARALTVNGLTTTPGQVTFLLTGNELPADIVLSQVPIKAAADGNALPLTVTPVDQQHTAGRAVMVVIDTSGSMKGGRIAAAQAAATSFADAVPADVRLGLVTVADNASTALAPTADRTTFKAAIQHVSAAGKTALYDGIQLASTVLTGTGERYAERRILTLSDGEDTASRATPADVAASLAKQHDTLDVVAYGPDAGGPTVANLVAGTGGKLVPAADASAVLAAFQGVAGTLSATVAVAAPVPPALAGKAATLHVEATVAGEVLAVDVPVTFAAAAAPAAAGAPTKLSPIHLRAASPLLLPIALGGVILALLLVGWLAGAALLGRSDLQHRVSQVDWFTTQGSGRRSRQGGGALVRTALAASEHAVTGLGDRGRIERNLERAAIPLRPAEWVLLRASVTVTGGALGWLLLPWWLGLPLGLLVGWLVTGMYRRIRANRRARQFADRLPDSLQLMVSSLRSGFSLAQSVDAVVREGQEPVSTEFGRAMAETRLGGELEDALDRMADRTNSDDMRWLVMAIRIQHEVGGSLSEIMETTVATMRERGRLARHVRALSAEGRLSAYVLVGMPIVIALWMLLFKRDYVRPLYTEPLGIAMLVGAIGLVAVGTFWVSRTIKVKV